MAKWRDDKRQAIAYDDSDYTDKDGKKIASAKTISKTVSDGAREIRKIKLDKVRLQFEVNNAKSFSFSFNK